MPILSEWNNIAYSCGRHKKSNRHACLFGNFGESSNTFMNERIQISRTLSNSSGTKRQGQQTCPQQAELSQHPLDRHNRWHHRRWGNKKAETNKQRTSCLIQLISKILNTNPFDGRDRWHHRRGRNQNGGSTLHQPPPVPHMERWSPISQVAWSTQIPDKSAKSNEQCFIQLIHKKSQLKLG